MRGGEGATVKHLAVGGPVSAQLLAVPGSEAHRAVALVRRRLSRNHRHFVRACGKSPENPDPRPQGATPIHARVLRCPNYRAHGPESNP